MSGLIALDLAAIEALSARAVALLEEEASFGPSPETGDGGGPARAFRQHQKSRVAALVEGGMTIKAALQACPGTGVGYTQMAALLARRERLGDRALEPYATRAKRGSTLDPVMVRKCLELLAIGLKPTAVADHPQVVALSKTHGPQPTRDRVRYLRDRRPTEPGERKPGSPWQQSEGLSSVSKDFYGGRPLAYVEADGTVHDAMAQTDDGSEVTLRPRAFIAADMSLHGPVSADILPADGDQLDVQELIVTLILPKGALAQAAGCKEAWLPHGIPDMFAVDRGKQFVARSVIRLSWLVGLVVVCVGAGMPFRKPFVEQVNSEVHQDLDTQLASWTGNSPLSRPDRGAHRAAILQGITVPDVRSRVIRYIADEFNVDYHRACAGTPNGAWERGTRQFAVRTWLDSERALRALCRVDFGMHKLTKNGMWIHGNWYGNPPVRDADETAEDRPFSVAPGARPKHLRELRRRQQADGLEGYRGLGRTDDMRWVEVCDGQGKRLAIAVCHKLEAMGRAVPLWEVEEMNAEERKREKKAHEEVRERRAAASAAEEAPKPGRRKAKTTTTRAGAKASHQADRAARNRPSLDDPYDGVPGPAAAKPKPPRRKARPLPVAA